jgi:hypothetical protein
MNDAGYISRLWRHLASYKENVLHIEESGVWGTQRRPYDHILPVDRRQLNIVAPLRDAFWREQSRRGWKLHHNFHHLSSSQALAFNLLYPLYPDVPAGMAATRRALGLPATVPCRLDFEAILDRSEGTNIDALFTTADGARTIVEIKLTERMFGTAKADDRHLAKLAGIYRPRLSGRVADRCLEPAAFFRDYQLYRSLVQIRRDSADRVVLLLPRARTQLWQHASSWCDAEMLDTLRGRVGVVALEDVVAALAADFARVGQDGAAINEVSQKYIPAG